MNNLSKSIDFLLENAGSVIQLRLRKEILGNLTKTEEENLLEKILQTPNYKLVESYVKPNGYIGNGMHSHSNWRGVKFHNTPLQDGEAAARLLADYRIPKESPIIKNFVAAMRNEDVLREEFSNFPTAVKRYENRYNCMNTGNSLMGLMYFMQGILGYGDDYAELVRFQDDCLRCFFRVFEIKSFDEITKESSARSNKYEFRIIDSNEYFPGAYNLEFLANTKKWRTQGIIRQMTDALNRINNELEPFTPFLIDSYGNYIGAFHALTSPLKPFRTDDDSYFYRGVYTNIAKLGVGESVEVLAQTKVNILEAIDSDGILRLTAKNTYTKWNKYRTLESASKEPKYAQECDATFWAVEFLHFVKNTELTK